MKMTSPSGLPGHDEETYNILTLDVINFTRVLIIITLIVLGINIIEVLAGPHY